ncbi:nuclear transport factor 2 family protein [Nocardia sp. NBC_00511]|uniref:nuclear transport factor 2 family protein n=1 Tax=Nocardia sp. NBC_00511 TaxID=2903591 RepID=UPI0030E5D932
MSEQSNIAVVQDLYASLGKADMAHVQQELLHDQAAVQVPGQHPHAGTHRGSKNAVEFFTKMRGASSEMSLEPQTIAAAGDQVMALVQVRGQRKGKNKTIDTRDVHVFTVSNGKITQFRSFHGDQNATDDYLS